MIDALARGDKASALAELQLLAAAWIEGDEIAREAFRVLEGGPHAVMAGLRLIGLVQPRQMRDAAND